MNHNDKKKEKWKNEIKNIYNPRHSDRERD